MDGAIILAADASRIARANVHLVPNPNVPTSETGTRHRTAERVARSIDVPVISVSEDMAVIAVYVGDEKHPLEPIPRLLTRANQALQTLERYKDRLDEVTLRLCPPSRSRTSSPCATSSPCSSAPRWCGASPRRSSCYIVELGVDGRLVRLQLEELMGGRRGRPPPRHPGLLPRGRRLAPRRGAGRAAPSSAPRTCSTSRRWPPRCTCPTGRLDLDECLQPRGYRLLAQDPAPARAGDRAHRRPLRRPAEDHAGHHRRPRRGRRRRRDPRRARSRRAVAAWPRVSILDRYS